MCLKQHIYKNVQLSPAEVLNKRGTYNIADFAVANLQRIALCLERVKSLLKILLHFVPIHQFSAIKSTNTGPEI